MKLLHFYMLRSLRVRIAAVLVIALTMIPSGVYAASSWSPTLLVNTEAFQTIDDGDGSSNIELRFGATANEILRWNISKSAFVFTDDVNVEGNLTASGTLSVEGASSLQGNVTVTGTVDTTGNITSDANLTINEDSGAADAVLTFGSDTTNETLTFENTNDQFAFSDDVEARGSFSGATIHAEGSLSASGTVFLQGTLTGALSFHGPFTSDCDDATNSKLLWDSSTGKFSCGSDQTGASSLTQTDADARYVNQSGDTMTGSLVIGNAKTLSVSGAVVTEGNLTINEDADSNNAVLTFGSDTTNETITWGNTGDRFELSDDIATTGSINSSGAVVTEGNMTLNEDADSNNAVLTFGSDTTNETITWGNTEDRFQFSDDVNVTGQLSASGGLSIEGATSIQGAATFGSTLSLGGITYTWPNSAASASGQVLSVNPTTGQLTWTSGIASSGSIVSLHPEYPGAVYFASGSTFVGQLVGSGGTASRENVYHWSSTNSSIHDYWISTRVRVPDNFTSWNGASPIQLRYRTSNATVGTNHVKLVLRDTADALVTLTGNQGLANASFTTATITGPESAGTYTPGGYITIYVKLASLVNGWSEAGFVNLNWETKD
ncbi:MAG TPA: hypothetical protein VJB82_00455 [Candidatus Peribacterales bacterium]|nr:hypothetical protein [Candidatus Peribacterales bacterium]